MSTPLVSVVMPAYNAARNIASAIDSALNQQVDLEIIVVNDCSLDNLDAVMVRYEDDARVVYVHNEHNLGAAESRNKAVRMARGEYVAFLDADDRWAEGKLQKQLDEIRRTNAALCCTARELMTPGGTLTGRVIPVKQKITYRELLKHNSISCSSVLMKTDLARRFPMECEESHEDYILWLKILRDNGFACGVNEPLLKYRVSNTGKSGSKLHSARMTFKVYRHMGFSWPLSVACFCSYALHGVWKYLPHKASK